MRIALLGNANWNPRHLDELVGEIERAEQDGFDGYWLVQLPLFGYDALSVITLAGARTERIELGTGVVPTFPRHPLILAQQALTASVATGGRLALGIGLSHQAVVEGVMGLSYERPAQHLREYLTVLRALLDEGRVAFDGERFNVHATLQVPGARKVSVLVAALAAATLKIAGEAADGTVTWMAGRESIESHIAPRITAAAEAAGRPAPRVCAAFPVAVTDDAEAARTQVKRVFQRYGQLPNYRRVLDVQGAEGPADVAVVGNEAEVEAQVRALAEAGVTDFVGALFPLEEDPQGSMERGWKALRGLVGRV